MATETEDVLSLHRCFPFPFDHNCDDFYDSRDDFHDDHDDFYDSHDDFHDDHDDFCDHNFCFPASPVTADVQVRRASTI